jgi:hypothetical protein
MNNGNIEIGGFFERGQITGKGFKKWKTDQGIYIYRGDLVESQINGFGVFKWPDGRHYIGDFSNAQMHGFGKMSWVESDGTKCVYKG